MVPVRHARPGTTLAIHVFVDEVRQHITRGPAIGVIHHRRSRETVSAGASLEDYPVLTYRGHGYVPARFRSGSDAGDDEWRGDRAVRGELEQKMSSQRVW